MHVSVRTYSLLGCDTTSRVFGIGKGVVLKQLRISISKQKCFNKRSVTTEEIAIAGERALLSLYSGSKKGDTLDQLRLLKK